MKNMIKHERLLELLHYDPDTGLFARIVGRPGYAAGSRVGSLNSYGYLTIYVDEVRYMAHRLAWFYMTKEWPKEQIDHINRVRLDNRVVNLREASPLINRQNSSKIKGLTLPLGVSWDKRDKAYKARIWVDRKPTYLGSHKTPEQAYAAYVKAKRVLHEGCTL